MKLHIIPAFAFVAALSACATSTVKMPDGSLHTCRHYLDGIVMWDGSDTDDATRACRVVGVERMGRS